MLKSEAKNQSHAIHIDTKWSVCDEDLKFSILNDVWLMEWFMVFDFNLLHEWTDMTVAPHVRIKQEKLKFYHVKIYEDVSFFRQWNDAIEEVIRKWCKKWRRRYGWSWWGTDKSIKTTQGAERLRRDRASDSWITKSWKDSIKTFDWKSKIRNSTLIKGILFTKFSDFFFFFWHAMKSATN